MEISAQRRFESGTLRQERGPTINCSAQYVLLVLLVSSPLLPMYKVRIR
jgi:hypothetical protein